MNKSIVFHKTTKIEDNSAFDFYIDREKDCVKWFEQELNLSNFYLTKSCTQSLEIALLTLDLPLGSEVILPSYAFVSLANAVTNIGCKCVFVDCEKNTMNIDALVIEEAVTEKTKAIITINYGGIACNYDLINQICKKYNLYLIEDNAHGIKSKYKELYLGGIGDISTFSFDHLKNFTCYQGGGIAINNEALLDKFNTVSQFGTNRNKYFEGKVNHYEWVSKGTNSILALPLTAILYNQITNAKKIIEKFNKIWKMYYDNLLQLEDESKIMLPKIPEYAVHNAHMFWVKTKSNSDREELIQFLKKLNIEVASHYNPLHKSSFGKSNSIFKGKDENTSIESERLLRLPLYYNIEEEEVSRIIFYVNQFYAT